MYFVGIDSSDQFDIYLENSSINVYLIAHTDESVGYYVDAVAVTDPTLNQWEAVDADTYGVPAIANGLILHAVNDHNSNNDFGVRKNGSTDDLDRGVAPQGQLQGAVGIDSGNVWEEFHGNANVNVSIAAYTTSLNIDSILHVDLDVLIRKSNGELRTTVGTNVANTPDLVVTNDWITATGTFTPGEYVIVDQTDYLELDLFAEVTVNDTSASVQFRIDDNTLDPGDRTGVENVGFNR